MHDDSAPGTTAWADLSADPEIHRLATQLESIDLEIVREAIVCDVPLLSPGLIKRVIDADPEVWNRIGPAAAAKLRGLLFLHYNACRHARELIGDAEVEHIRTEAALKVLARLDNSALEG